MDHSYNMYDRKGNLAADEGGATEDICKSSDKVDIKELNESAPNDHNDHQIEPLENASDGAVKEVCPFVCGICSEKFDKVALFYAHLKTHENFIGSHFAEMKQKKKLPGAQQDQGNLDDNVFKCGICQVGFPSMSLLHEHMVGDENISDYSYSNADHTARPDSRIVIQSDSDTEIKEIQITASSTRGAVSNKGGKDKSVESSTSGTQTQEKGKRTDKIIDRVKVKQSTDGINQKKSVKNKFGLKRKAIETNSLDLSNEFQKKRKTEDGSDKKNILPMTNMAVSPIVQTYGTRGNLSPISRSSRRMSCKRVDYKALAGFSSPKYDSEHGMADVSEDISTDVKETTSNLSNCKHEIQMQKEKTDSDKSQKKVLIKVVSKKKVKSYRSFNKINPKESIEKISDLTKKEDEKKPTENDNEEIGESNILGENDTALEELAIKADGTSADADSKFSETIKVEVDSDYDVNASDYDSDDDFIEEENHNEAYQDDIEEESQDEDYQDDDQNDPDFELQKESEDDGEDEVIVSINDTRDPDAYLKKFKVKKKRIFKTGDGQPVKNCLYPCAVCGRYYLWKALKKHMYSHVTTREVQCTQCGKKYKSERHLKDHIRSVHEMKKYGCPKCSSILKGNQSFEKHIMNHILNKEITAALDEVEKVEVSEEEYIKWRAQQENKVSQHPKKKKKKKRPSETEDSVDRLDLEMLKEGPPHGEHIVLESDIVGTSKNQDCKVCKKHFLTHESLLTHMLEHKNEEHFCCKVCNGFFQTPEHLQNHMIAVHGDRDLVCDICGEHLRSNYALWSHKGKHLMKKDAYYSEEIVQKLQEEIAERRKCKRKSAGHSEQSATSQTKLNRECEICGMEVLAARYKRHLEVHNTTKDWECDICHNFYKTRRYLIDHKKKTHFAEVVCCDICGQKFKGKTYLEIHKQTHGPKDKKCPHCEKGFTTLMYLKTHLLTHEEKKRFRCDKCMAAFSHKQRLAIHMVEVHAEGARRPCKYCGDLFPSRQKARKHERIAHEGFVMPTRIKKKPSYLNVLKINETDNESLENKIVRLMPSGTGFVTVSPGMVKLPISKNKAVENGVQKPVQNKSISDSSEVQSAAGTGQYIKLENGEEYQVMIEKEGRRESLEFVELTEEEQSVIIQEADGVIAQGTSLTEEQEENVEQILEIPENAEQCQILLYPDGSFKLLNVVDNTNSS